MVMNSGATWLEARTNRRARSATTCKACLAAQQAAGKTFTDEERGWVERMAEHIAGPLGIAAEDRGYAPFDQGGKLGGVHQIFAVELPKVLDAMNRELVA
jgi:hypothetical protein